MKNQTMTRINTKDLERLRFLAKLNKRSMSNMIGVMIDHELVSIEMTYDQQD